MFLFIDLNSYFATVEQQANKSLRGKPVGVCEHTGGIIIAASKEAKKIGIGTGTPTWEAKKIYPQIALVAVDPLKVRSLTKKFYRIAEDYADNVEHVSIDEVSIELSADYESAVKIAWEIKHRIQKEMGEWVTCSIGIAQNRLLAKVGTELQKPDGLVVICDQVRTENHLNGAKIFHMQDLYDLLELEDMPGIGKNMHRNLRVHGITSLKQLSKTSLLQLKNWFGITGVWLHDLANFKDPWGKINLDERAMHSIGHQYALGKKRAIYKKTVGLGLLWKLTEKVCVRLRTQNITGNTIHFYCNYVDGGSIGGSKKFKIQMAEAPLVLKAIEPWINKVQWNRGLAHIGLTVSGLQPRIDQGELFPLSGKHKQTAQAMDNINKRWGDFTVSYGHTVSAEDLANDSVGFGRTRERKDW